MGIKEHALGKGTIAYAGESREYWEAKTARLRRGRLIVTAAIGAVALLLLAWLVSPLGPSVESARVVSVGPAATASSADPGSFLVQVSLPDGGRGSFTSTTGSAVGSAVTVTAFPDGHLIEGDLVVLSLWTAGLLLAAVAIGRGVWQYRRRHVVTSFR